MTPYREFRAYHGLNPTIPHILAGWRIEPPVSVQRAAGTSPAATAAAVARQRAGATLARRSAGLPRPARRRAPRRPGDHPPPGGGEARARSPRQPRPHAAARGDLRAPGRRGARAGAGRRRHGGAGVRPL